MSGLPIDKHYFIREKGKNISGITHGKKKTEISLPVQRIHCQDCGCIKFTTIGFADPRKRYTKALRNHVIDLCRCMTILDTAKHLGMSWDTVKEILKNNLMRKYKKIILRNLRHIAIDEIAVKKGHKYLTVVYDLISGKVVFVGDGKGEEALEPFWKRLKHSRAEIESVAMDMSPAYIAAVENALPKAEIVFDHFHVVKLFNDKLSKYRRSLYNKLTENNEKKIIKGTRWLLLKNPENLDESKNEKSRLEEALNMNKPLATAYYLKEDLRMIWSQKNKESAEKCLESWISKAVESGIPMLVKFAKSLTKYKNGILAYYTNRLSSGPLEGTNNKIKTLKRQAYGFRDIEFFKLRILAIHEAKYSFTG